jgi:uncharacterized protein (DUF58 family)
MNSQQQLQKLGSNGIELTVKELLQYQPFSDLLDLTPKVMPQAKMAGSYVTKHKGRGMEFDEARQYQAGDDIRAIDWRVTARTGKTHTKIYREERERPVYIFCDLCHSMQFGTQLLLKAVQASHLTALIGWAASKRGDKVGALLFNQNGHRECKPLTRKRAVLSLCHELIKIQNHVDHELVVNADQQEIAFTDACARLRRLAKPGSLIYLISDFTHMNDAAIAHLVQLSRHSEIQSYAIRDPFEDALPKTKVAQPVVVTDGIQRQTWLLGDDSLSTKYAQARDQQLAHIRQQLAQFKSSMTLISAGQPLAEQLLAHRGRR